MTHILRRPGIILLLVLSVHAVVGVPNYNFYSFEVDYISYIFPLLVFLFVFSISILIPARTVRPSVRCNEAKLESLLWITLLLSLAISALYLTLQASGSGGFWARFSRNPLLVNLSQLGIPSVLVLFSIYFNRIKYDFIGMADSRFLLLIVSFTVYCMLQALQGYRSPIFILFMALGIILIHGKWIYSGFKLPFSMIIRFFFFAMLGVFLLSYVAIYRVGSDYSYIDYYHQLDWKAIPIWLDNIAPFFATIRADFVHLDRFLLEYSKFPSIPGSIFLSDLSTWLPGTQLGSRNIVGDYIGAREMPNGVPMSITIGMFGIIYSDFGYLGVVVFPLMLCLLLNYFLNRSLFGSSFHLAVFGYLLACLLKSVHSGYLDFSFYFQCFYLFFVYRVAGLKFR